MPELSFTDQHDRLRHTLRNSVEGCLYESAHEEEGGRIVVLVGRRIDGPLVNVRFRGVSDSTSTSQPSPGDVMHLRRVRSAASLVGLILPFLRRGLPSSRVTIAIGPAQLDISCQDAEWWEESAAP
jgi:hypothetical protein